MAQNDTLPRPAGVRQSAASTDEAWLTYGNPGTIARRGWDTSTTEILSQAAGMNNGIRWMAETAPQRLLRLLMEDATAQKALDNDMTVGFSPGSTRLVAKKDYRRGRGKIDDDATAELQRVFQLYDPTGGYAKAGTQESLMTFQRHGLERTNDTGQFMFEGVLGKRKEGVVQIVDFDGLTTRYRDDKKTYERVLEQRQKAAKDGWKKLDLITTFTNSWRASYDNPYGSPRYGAWLKMGLRKLARQKSLHEWLHAVAWPRLVFHFDIAAAIALAERSLDRAKNDKSYKSFLSGAGPGGKDLDPHVWANQQLRRYQAYLKELESSDILAVPGNTKVDVANPSSIGGLDDILKMERVEEAQALLQLLNMLGITDGGTQAYAEVQWDQYALSITSARSMVNGAAVGIGNLHFRALGLDLICEVEASPVRPFDSKVVEETRALQIQNAKSLIYMGFSTIEDEAVRLTGSGVADEKRAEEFFSKPEAAKADASADPAADKSTTKEGDNAKTTKK